MSPQSIKLMSNEDLRSSLLLYRELQSKSTSDELILRFIENEWAKRMLTNPWDLELQIN